MAEERYSVSGKDAKITEEGLVITDPKVVEKLKQRGAKPGSIEPAGVSVTISVG